MSFSGSTLAEPVTTVSGDEISIALSVAESAEACLAAAARADVAGNRELQKKCLERAIALDRNCQTALHVLASIALEESDSALAFALLEEADRAGLLMDEARPLHERLLTNANSEPEFENYLRAVGRVGEGPAERTRRIVLVTNLFPPQELGGYGRMMWEFAHGLIARGHSVTVLTSEATEFGKEPTPAEAEMERHVHRTLALVGTWAGGRCSLLSDRREVMRRLRDNHARLRTAVTKLNADLVLAGNLDLLGASILHPALGRKIPVLHTLANANPGYSLGEQPREAHYWVAPCSDWNGGVFKAAGYAPARVETLYPGAPINRFFRLFLPDTQRLRICYASLVLPYKGAGTLVQALGRLHDAGVEFSAEIAGDAPDPAFIAELHAIVQAKGMAHKVQFPGFLDRNGLSALFARCNVLVFPSRFEEPFGISQVEALAAGLVVVSSGTGGAKEIIRDKSDGLLFAAGDDAELANKLALLARSSGLMAKLQRNGQARATAFSVANAVKKIESLAAEVCAISLRESSGS